MFEHLAVRWSDVDFIEIHAMKIEQDASWDTNENIVTYFTKVERICKRLKKKITIDDK